MDRVIVIAPDYDRFRNWCLIENDPPLKERDPRWVVITNREHIRKLFGLNRKNSSIYVIDWPYTSRDYQEIRETLIRLKLWHPKTGAINIWNPTPEEYATFWSGIP